MMKHSIVAVMVLGLWFGGCTSKDAPMKTFVMQIPQDTPRYSSSSYHGQTLQVTYPDALKDRLSQRMYFSYSPVEQGSYLNSQWSNSTGKLIQGFTINTLSNSGLFKGVISYESTAQADYRLESTVYDFSHRVRGKQSHAIVSIQYNLISVDSGRLAKTKRFNYVIPTKTIDAEGYVDATNEAMRRLSGDLLAWLR